MRKNTGFHKKTLYALSYDKLLAKFSKNKQDNFRRANYTKMDLIIEIIRFNL